MSEKSGKGKWSEIEVASWDDLIRELHSSRLIPTQEQQGGHRRSPYLFRGMSDAAWPLETSLQRLGSPPDRVEQPLLRAFVKYAPSGTFERRSEWERLAVAQHNGLPTRLLDWTVSPLIAAHFATAEAAHSRADGVVWCVQADIVRDHLLPQSMRDQLHEAQAYIYNVDLLADSKFPTLAKFDATDADGNDILIFLEPPSIDQRIHNQFGVLSAMNGCAKGHDDFLQACSRKHSGLVRRIIVKSSAKAEVRAMLDQNNITERMLFPGLPGLSTWLKRYYGPAYDNPRELP